MTQIGLLTIANDLADFLSAATGLTRTQNPGQLTDGMNDPNTLQIYPQNVNSDASSGIQQTTYQGRVKQSLSVFNADLYGRQRSDLATDMLQLLTVADEVTALLEGITTAPYFGPGTGYVKAFTFTGERVTFQYGDPLISYMGFRWAISLWIY